MSATLRAVRQLAHHYDNPLTSSRTKNFDNISSTSRMSRTIAEPPPPIALWDIKFLRQDRQPRVHHIEFCLGRHKKLPLSSALIKSRRSSRESHTSLALGRQVPRVQKCDHYQHSRARRFNLAHKKTSE